MRFALVIECGEFALPEFLAGGDDEQQLIFDTSFQLDKALSRALVLDVNSFVLA